MPADKFTGKDMPLTKVDQVFTVATVPDATLYPYRLIVVSNGAAGVACLAISNGAVWKVIAAIGTTISAT